MCVHRESTAQRAVKVLRKSHMDEEEKRMLFNEINILKEIVSPNLFAITVPDQKSVHGLSFGVINATKPEINYKNCLTSKDTKQKS